MQLAILTMAGLRAGHPARRVCAAMTFRTQRRRDAEVKRYSAAPRESLLARNARRWVAGSSPAMVSRVTSRFTIPSGFPSRR